MSLGIVELLLLLCLCLLMPLAALALYLLLAHLNRWWPFGEGGGRYPRRQFYVQDQVVLSGSRAQVDAALRHAQGVQLEPLERLEFSGLSLPAECPVPEDFVVALYRIEGFRPDVERAIRALQDTPAGRDGGITAEPNWLTGHPWEPEGSPWEPEGSPWEPEGSPWEPEGSGAPRSATRRLEVDAQPEWFSSQWAWEAIDLAGGLKSADGRGVLVGVFDTSPYDFAPGTRNYTRVVPFVRWPAPMKLSVSHPVFAAEPGAAPRPLPDVRNHGLFVAGLIHAVAPKAQLYLVRVLNSHNRGDLFTLLREVFLFLQRHRGAGSMVLNLSLGIRVPPPEAGFGLPAEVRALYYLTRAARCLGAVVVAAAGNESGPQMALPANLPAQWEHVIGVAASTAEGRRACFSNRGDLAAPGGDGARRPLRVAPQAMTEQCVPAVRACDGPECAYGLIGPALEDPARTGFIFWSGSSFAAPLVSGLAALAFQAGKGAYTPEDVEALLRCGAAPAEDEALGAGIINVRSTLRRCRRQMKQEAAAQSGG